MDVGSKIKELPEKDRIRYNTNLRDIIGNEEDSRRYGITDYLNIPDDQFDAAREKLYEEMFGVSKNQKTLTLGRKI